MTEEPSNTLLMVFAIVAGLGLFGVVVVTIAAIPQQAEAAGCPLNTPAANASKGRCFGH